jgi:acyl-[acyl-carrier-protein]-phospholipid O-acyltransferase/long-chain-fatty-acid--[acyl-carrier-protein] ligase
MLHLLKLRSFSALLTSQFLGAFNDNAFKQLVMLLTVSAATTEAIPWVAESGYALDAAGNNRQGVVAFLFALPFVLLCTTTGALADRFSKSTIIKLANVLEIVVMGLALFALYSESYRFLLATVFFMGAQSALFGPSKYGSIRELVQPQDMSRANALIQTTTTLAILLGVGLAGVLAEKFSDALWVPGMAYIGFAVLGWLASLPIQHLPPRQPERRIRVNAFAEAREQWRAVRGQGLLVVAVFGSAYYYLVGALLFLVVNEYGMLGLGLNKQDTSMLMMPVVLGIAAGAVIAGRVSGDRIEGGLVPIGVVGMAGALLALGLGPASHGFAQVMLGLLGLASGMGSLPVRTLVQVLPKDERRGAVLGFSQTLDFVGILLAGPVFSLFQALGFGGRTMMTAVGVMVLAALLPAFRFAGHHALRLVLWLLVHTLYRIRVRGADNVPTSGGALLVANHVSFVDALLVAAAAKRPVRFLMFRPFFDLPVLGWFAQRMNAIPVAAGDSPEDRELALGLAAEAARNGELVCIFAEGGITRTGHLMPFAAGMETIARRANVPIIPVALDRLWGSMFSFAGGKAVKKLPRALPYRVDLAVGVPVAPDTTAFMTRQHIQELIADLRSERHGRRGSLGWRFVRQARSYAGQPAVVDGTGTDLTYRKLLVGAVCMREVLRPRLGAKRSVAVLLPPGAGGALANIALALDDRVSVNLNYTMENADLARMCEVADVGVVITARRFLTALQRESPLPEARTIYLEDVRPAITGGMKLAALLKSFLPGAWLADHLAPKGDDASERLATIIFSSGSTGTPKGVMLSHSNVLSNTQSVLQVVALGPGDAVLGILPFFHSFGYTVTLWATLLSGARAVYHANPLEAKVIGELCAKYEVTITIGTPTFYQAYLRRCTPEQFQHVRLAMSGAQKLGQGLADAWHARFGSQLMEGYGCTELSPVVSANLPTPEGTSPRHRLFEPGTIGRPVPGVAVRIVDPDTRVPRGEGEEGLIEVKGPNVMKGYLGQPEKTAEVLRGGWYTTGDIGVLDRRGFLRITDRLSRFSKIGGEMVPHGRIEEALQGIAFRKAGLTADEELESSEEVPEVAVAAVEHDTRGEELIVLYTNLPFPATELAEALAETDLPRLFQPKPANYFSVPRIPKLGTGKVDLRALKQLAAECAADGVRV